jgi:hypothetical protein
MKRNRDITPLQSASAFAVFSAYVALACGLKLDGFIKLPWTLLLAPVWFPIALMFAVAFFYVLLGIMLIAVDALVRKLRGRM